MQKFLAAVFHLARPAVRRVLRSVLDAAQEQALEEAKSFAREQEVWSGDQRRAAMQTAEQAVEALRSLIDKRLGA